MIFSNRNLPFNVQSVCFNNYNIERCSSVRFLGVELDENLKFDTHIKNISLKISKNTGILRKLSSLILNFTLLNLYYALIEPYLNYCVLIFGRAYDIYVYSLEVAQRRSVRAICGESSRAHSNQLFLNLGILKFKDLYKYNLGIYMYKRKHALSQYETSHTYGTRGRNLSTPLFQRLTLTQRQSVKYQLPKNWNTIPSFIVNSQSLNSFKRNYEKYLVSLYHSQT